MARAKKEKRIKLTLVRSPIGYKKDQKDTVRSLGLRRMNHSVEHTDTPMIRGMINKVSHLLQVEEVE